VGITAIAPRLICMSLTNYRQRAEECRRLADLRAGTDHWAAFLEMAETWEKLAAVHEYSQQLKSSGVLLEPRQR
jgi:hypothetical protein